jgi:acetoin utilization protein AcuB
MLVRYWMNKTVTTIDADDNMENAINLLKKHDIRMLPVMYKGKLVGIVTDRDLKRASASDATSLEIHELNYLIHTIKVKEIMTKDPITVPWDHTVEETVEVLLEHKISGVPVVDNFGKIVGTITQLDLFRTIISLTGVARGGIQLGVDVEDRPGSVKEITDTIRKHGGRVLSILASSNLAAEGLRRVYIRIYGLDRWKFPALKESLAEHANLLYIVDHLDKGREVF